MATHRKCLHMKWIKGRLYNCGHCPACIGRRNSEIACRVLLDMRHSAKNSCYQDFKLGARFVHLTYNDESLPDNSSLVKEHFVQYIKRVRERVYRLTGCRIMFVGSGEYGSKCGRPHYHIFFWRLPEFRGLFDILVDCWKKHHCGSRVVVDRLRGKPSQAVNYCVGYAGKSSSKYDKNPRESGVDYLLRTGRQAPFVQWSYGVGLDWFNAHRKELENNMSIFVDGRQLAFPRYFRKKLFEDISFSKWEEQFDKQIEDFRAVGMKNLDFDDFFKAYVYADCMARGLVSREYTKDRARMRNIFKKAIDSYVEPDVERSELDEFYVRKVGIFDRLFEYCYDLGLCDDDNHKFVLNAMLDEWRLEHAAYYEKMYIVNMHRVLDDVAAPVWSTESYSNGTDDVQLYIKKFASRYRQLQDEYIKLKRAEIEQAGLNYCAVRQLKDCERYLDEDYGEVEDRELDLPVLREKIR